MVASNSLIPCRFTRLVPFLYGQFSSGVQGRLPLKRGVEDCENSIGFVETFSITKWMRCLRNVGLRQNVFFSVK